MSVIKLDLSLFIFFFLIMLWMYVQLQNFAGTFLRLFQHGSTRRTQSAKFSTNALQVLQTPHHEFWYENRNPDKVHLHHKERWIIHVIAQISSFTGQKPSTQHVLQSIQSPLKRIIEWKIHYTNRHLREDIN